MRTNGIPELPEDSSHVFEQSMGVKSDLVRNLCQSLRQGEYCFATVSQTDSDACVQQIRENISLAQTRFVHCDFSLQPRVEGIDEWYGGLAQQLGRELKAPERMNQLWRNGRQINSVSRLFMALSEITLVSPEHWIIVFSHLETLADLTFSVDELFAAIREFYNRRSLEPSYRRLTFCMLGAVSPMQLIRDVRSTPFNIGDRFELNQVRAELMKGEADSRKLARRIAHKVIRFLSRPLQRLMCRGLLQWIAISSIRKFILIESTYEPGQ